MFACGRIGVAFAPAPKSASPLPMPGDHNEIVFGVPQK